MAEAEEAEADMAHQEALVETPPQIVVKVEAVEAEADMEAQGGMQAVTMAVAEADMEVQDMEAAAAMHRVDKKPCQEATESSS